MPNGYPTSTHYSEHFTRRELDCHCGCDTPKAVEHELVITAAALELLRTRLGKPVYINSGYRCPSYNRRIGGAEQSQHMLGTAADVSCKTISPSYVAHEAEGIPVFEQGGIGRYAGFTHVDRRKGAARWNG